MKHNKIKFNLWKISILFVILSLFLSAFDTTTLVSSSKKSQQLEETQTLDISKTPIVEVTNEPTVVLTIEPTSILSQPDIPTVIIPKSLEEDNLNTTSTPVPVETIVSSLDNTTMDTDTPLVSDDNLELGLRRVLISNNIMEESDKFSVFIVFNDISQLYIINYKLQSETQNPSYIEPDIAIASYTSELDIRIPDIDKENFNSFLDSLSNSILSEDVKELYRYSSPIEISSMAYTNHYLPWQNGLSHPVTQGPDNSNFTYKHSGKEKGAWDWSMAIGTELWASKSGTVSLIVESNTGPLVSDFVQGTYGWCTTGKSPNYIVINNDDGSASLYLHLKYNGVPDNLTNGSRVNKGDLIGYSGNTGYVCTSSPSSTAGAHLHFQVQAQGGWYTQSDYVIFSDPGWSINTTSPTSGNVRSNGGSDTTKPSGSFTSPASGSTINSGSVTISANASDNSGGSGVNHVLFTAKWNNQWHNLATDNSSPYSINWNMCSAGVPDGDIELGMSVIDNSNNVFTYSDLIANPHITKSYNCGSSGSGNWRAEYYDSINRWWDNNNSNDHKCGEDLSGPYLDKNYGSSGPCGMDGDTWIGDYSATINFPSGNYVFILDHDDGMKLWVNGDNVADRGGSVGGNDYVCPARSLSGNTPMRAMLREDGGDARIKVTWSTDTSLCNPPASVPSLSSPNNGQIFNEGESINLSWSSTGDQYYGEIWGGPGGTLSFGWQTGTTKSIGSQWPGYIYSWRVKASNNIGPSDWSSTRTFTVKPKAPTSLTGSATSCSTSAISWTDQSGSEDGYRIYRNGSAIATTTGTSYTNSGLSGSTPYSYYVKSYKNSIESDASNTINITTGACPPASGFDSISSPRTIASIPYLDSTSTSTATKASDDPALTACSRAAGQASVWYKYTPSGSREVSLDTFGSNYDTMIGVWRGSPGNLTAVTCNDDKSGGLQSQVTFAATQGTNYYVGISEYNGILAELNASENEEKQLPEVGALAGGSLVLHGTSFADVPGSHGSWRYIEGFYSQGITTGCSANPLNYCPDSSVTRAAMAVFVLRAKHGATYQPPAATGIFADLPVTGKEWMQPWVEQLYREGITTGCSANPLKFCPENTITRAAMAVFVLRAKHGASYQPPAASGYFADLPVTGKEWMQPWVDQFYREGITTGCGANPLRYCPEDPVIRSAMAVFTDRAFGFGLLP